MKLLLDHNLSPRLVPLLADLVTFTGIFAPLQDQATFAQVQLHPELGTLIWQNGADLDPDVLYALVSRQPLPTYTKTSVI